MKKWTKEEIHLLKKAVSDSPENLTLAFAAVSEVIDRTPSACANFWYKHMKKLNGSYALMCYSGQTGKSVVETEKKQSLWTKILSLFR